MYSNAILEEGPSISQESRVANLGTLSLCLFGWLVLDIWQTNDGWLTDGKRTSEKQPANRSTVPVLTGVLISWLGNRVIRKYTWWNIPFRMFFSSPPSLEAFQFPRTPSQFPIRSSPSTFCGLRNSFWDYPSTREIDLLKVDMIQKWSRINLLL